MFKWIEKLTTPAKFCNKTGEVHDIVLTRADPIKLTDTWKMEVTCKDCGTGFVSNFLPSNMAVDIMNAMSEDDWELFEWNNPRIRR